MPVKQFAERDRSIIIDFLSGDATRKDLAKKHGVTYSRIAKIVEHELKRLECIAGMDARAAVERI